MLLDIPLLFIYIHSVNRSEPVIAAGMQCIAGYISSKLMAKAGTVDPQMASA